MILNSFPRNIRNLTPYFNRHPANVPALITELQMKVEQDTYLLAEIKKRLWEQKFERQTHQINFRLLKNLVAEAVMMHNKLLEHKYEYKKALTTQAVEEERNLALSLEAKTKGTLGVRFLLLISYASANIIWSLEHS